MKFNSLLLLDEDCGTYMTIVQHVWSRCSHQNVFLWWVHGYIVLYTRLLVMPIKMFLHPADWWQYAGPRDTDT